MNAKEWLDVLEPKLVEEGVAKTQFDTDYYKSVEMVQQVFDVMRPILLAHMRDAAGPVLPTHRHIQNPKGTVRLILPEKQGAA